MVSSLSPLSFKALTLHYSLFLLGSDNSNQSPFTLACFTALEPLSAGLHTSCSQIATTSAGMSYVHHLCYLSLHSIWEEIAMYVDCHVTAVLACSLQSEQSTCGLGVFLLRNCVIVNVQCMVGGGEYCLQYERVQTSLTGNKNCSFVKGNFFSVLIPEAVFEVQVVEVRRPNHNAPDCGDPTQISGRRVSE